jgi:hypothetical protein
LNQITIKEIENYLDEVLELIRKDKYRIDTNNRRQHNIDLYTNYVIDERLSKEILLSLQPDDFSGIVSNEHSGYEYEKLYIFGKTVSLIERFGDNEKQVSLYIKFNKLDNGFVIVISFHEEDYPLYFPFRK